VNKIYIYTGAQGSGATAEAMKEARRKGDLIIVDLIQLITPNPGLLRAFDEKNLDAVVVEGVPISNYETERVRNWLLGIGENVPKFGEYSRPDYYFCTHLRSGVSNMLFGAGLPAQVLFFHDGGTRR